MIFQIIQKLHERHKQCLWRIKAEFMKGRIYVKWSHVTNLSNSLGYKYQKKKKKEEKKSHGSHFYSANMSLRTEIPSWAIDAAGLPPTFRGPKGIWVARGTYLLHAAPPPSICPGVPWNYSFALCARHGKGWETLLGGSMKS